uniref:Uncharacterized protein n=1 Tax=Anguilla anguilla TaxID=7936 RepID=A0A0E9R1G4_ANGAN
MSAGYVLKQFSWGLCSDLQPLGYKPSSLTVFLNATILYMF